MLQSSPLKALLLLLVALFVADVGYAQLGRRLQRAAQRGAERALERQAQRKTEEAVDEIFAEPQRDSRRTNPDTGEVDYDGSEDDQLYGADGGGGDAGRRGSMSAPGEAEAAGPAFSMTSKYDFEPGASIIHYDDFSRAAIGDFPTGYNTMGGAEVVTVSTAPGKWLKVDQATGQLAAFDFTEFPENFTLELDLIVDVPEDDYRYKGEFGILFTDVADPEAHLQDRLDRIGKNNAVFWIDRDISRGFWKAFNKTRDGEGTKGNSGRIDHIVNDGTRGTPHHIAIWRQGKRMRMYLNEEKAYDIPLAWSGSESIRGLRFVVQSSQEGDQWLLSNVRLAKGAPDTRSKLETEGRLVTYGITFASGSAEVEPSSAGTLKRIAQTLDANPGMRVRITGHTDSDGDEASNQKLSEQRAAAVSTTLAQHYGVDASRLETAGKGESEPIATDDSPAAKAQNRRVVLEVL